MGVSLGYVVLFIPTVDYTAVHYRNGWGVSVMWHNCGENEQPATSCRGNINHRRCARLRAVALMSSRFCMRRPKSTEACRGKKNLSEISCYCLQVYVSRLCQRGNIGCVTLRCCTTCFDVLWRLCGRKRKVCVSTATRCLNGRRRVRISRTRRYF